MSKVILFQGDSVTDCDRSREDLNDLGLGYPKFVAGFFNARYPGEDVNFLNRGISGNRVRDL
ncbi:MAG: GDSL family lipase, partial [Oscillospiraceae bacterium]